MKKPKVVELDQKARDTLKRELIDSNLPGTTKETLFSTIDFAIELQQQLLDAKISIATLKRLFNGNSESLKKSLLMS